MYFQGDDFPKKKKRISKNDMIYGIFNEENSPSSDENPLEGKKRLLSFLNPAGKSQVGGFVKSTTLLHDPNTKVNVKWGKGVERNEDVNRSKKLEETLNMIKQFDQEKGKSEHVGKSSKRSKQAYEFDGDDIFSEEEKHELENEGQEKESMKRRRIFDFKKKGDQVQMDMSLHNLPTGFGAKTEEPEQKKKIKLSAENYAERAEGEKLNDQYGVGYKILKNLGFKEGKGLGKNKQGRVKPVEAVSKSKFNSEFEMRLDQRETEQQRFSKYDIGDDIFKDLEEKDDLHESYKEKNDKEEAVIHRRWNKSTRKRYFKEQKDKQPVQPNNKEKGSDNSSALKPVLAHQKIVDMRGPNIMFYDDINVLGKITKNSVAQDDSSEKKATILGELVINIKGALERQKHNSRVCSQRLSLDKDKLVTFDYESKKLKTELDMLVDDYEILKEFRNDFKVLEDLSKDQSSLQKTSPEEVLKKYSRLYELSAENFLKYNCHYCMIYTLTNRMKPLFNADNLLKALTTYHPLFEKISKFLNVIYDHKKSKLPEGKDKKQGSSSSHYGMDYGEGVKTQKTLALILECEQVMNILLENTILSLLRTFLINEWLPRDESIIVIDLLKLFQEIFPNSFLDNIVENYIVRRLIEEVKAWEPKKDKIMIHLWIHPWLEIIEEAKLSPLWKLIQNRLAEALKQWSPADKSAYYLLAPWKQIFDVATWNNFMMRCIIPKLFHALSDFEINLKDQNIDVIEWITIWFEILEEDHIAMLLEEYVLKKIHSMAECWLKNIEGEDDIKDLSLWLDGWKNLLGPRALECELVSEFFREINKRVSL